MPITRIQYQLIRSLKDADLLPQNGHLIEFGQSNWTGTVPVELLQSDIRKYISDPNQRDELLGHCENCTERLNGSDPDVCALWELPKIFFTTFFNNISYTAVDLGGTDEALKLDLNEPLSLEQQYDILFDFGTAEHVFNVYQVFKTAHEIVRPGGLMIHGLPFQGWVDHGFFNFQPTFYLDLAAANNYQIRALVYWENASSTMIQIHSREQVAEMVMGKQIRPNSTLFVIYFKSNNETPFRIPMQGYYEGAVSEKVKTAWMKLR